MRVAAGSKSKTYKLSKFGTGIVAPGCICAPPHPTPSPSSYACHQEPRRQSVIAYVLIVLLCATFARSHAASRPSVL